MRPRGSISTRGGRVSQPLQNHHGRARAGPIAYRGYKLTSQRRLAHPGKTPIEEALTELRELLPAADLYLPEAHCAQLLELFETCRHWLTVSLSSLQARV